MHIIVSIQINKKNINSKIYINSISGNVNLYIKRVIFVLKV